MLEGLATGNRAVQIIDILWDVFILLAIRLVLDTNVIVAALCSRNGASILLLRVVDWGAVTPFCPTALFLEYEAVLSREETRQVDRTQSGRCRSGEALQDRYWIAWGQTRSNELM